MKNKSYSFLFFLIFAFAIILRFIKLGDFSLWIDEGFTWYISKFLSFKELIYERIKAGHFPFYFLFIKVWIKIFGDSEFSLRFPSLIGGILSILIFHKLSERVLSSNIARAWSVIIFAFSLYGIEISQEARMYSLALLFFLLWLLFLFKIIAGSECYLKYSLSLLFFLLNGSIVIIPYLCILIFLIFNLKIKTYRKLIGLNLTILIPFLFLFIPIIRYSQFTEIGLYYLRHKFNPYIQILLFSGWILKFFREIAGFLCLNVNKFPLSLFLFYIFIFFLLVLFYISGLIKLPYNCRKPFIIMTLGSFIPFILSYKFETRYLYYLFPIVSLSWGNIIYSLASKYKIYIIILCLLWIFLYIQDGFKYFNTPKTSWRELTSYIQKNESSREEIWLFPRFCRPVFTYYYQGSNKIVEIGPNITSLSEPKNGVWYIIWLNVKLPWVGGKFALNIDKSLKFSLSSHLKREMLKYYLTRKGIIEISHYVPRK